MATEFRITWTTKKGKKCKGNWVSKEALNAWKRDSFHGLPKVVADSIVIEKRGVGDK